MVTLPGALPAWHMWGGRERVRLDLGMVSTQPQPVPQQIARISYNRPESWRWLMHAQVAAASPGLVLPVQFSVSFGVQVGIGRAFVSLNVTPRNTNATSFVTFEWDALNLAGLNRPIWSTRARGPALIPPSGVKGEWFDVLVAQNIQVEALVENISPPQAGEWLDIDVSAFFAPNVHIRPDWFRDADDKECFPSGEVGGT